MHSFDRYPGSDLQERRGPGAAILYRGLVAMLTVGARTGDGRLTLADLPGFVSYRCLVRTCAAVTAVSQSLDRLRVRPRSRSHGSERRVSVLGRDDV